MRLLLTRHPVTRANMEGIIEDNFRGEIHGAGYDQIEKLVTRLRLEEIDKLYSSPAERCVTLAERIAREKGVEPIYNQIFRELDNGEWFGRKKSEINRLELDTHDPTTIKPAGGESLQDLHIRANEAFSYIERDSPIRGMLISHGWFLKLFVGNQIGLNILDAIKNLKFSNCALSEIRKIDGGCIVEYLNNRDFL